MTKRLLLLVALALAGVANAEGELEVAAVSTSNTTARSAKLSSGWKLVYCTVATHYRTGSSTVESVTTDLTIPATTAWQVYIGLAEQYIAFILNSSTGSCSIYKQNPGPTGVPPQHASLGGSHQITNAGTDTTDVGGTLSVSVTAGTSCVCTTGDTESELLSCSRVTTTLTITTTSPATTVSYICTT